MKQYLIILFFIFISGNVSAQMSPSLRADTNYIDIWHTINARNYGVIPNTGEPMGAKIRNAINAAKNRGQGSRVFLEPGVYLIEPNVDPNNRTIFGVSNAKGLIIEGNNSTFLFQDCYQGAFSFGECDGVEVRNLTIDYVNEPWTQGVVIAVNKSKGSFTFQANVDCYDLMSDPRFVKVIEDSFGSGNAVFGTVRDKSDPTLLKRSANDHFMVRNVEKIKDLTYEVYITNTAEINPNFIAVDDYVVINNRGGTSGAIALYKTGNVYISNVTVYATPDGAIVGGGGFGNFFVNNFHYRIKPGSSRWISGNSDGILFHEHRGKAIVENCFLEGASDDCINFYETPSRLNSIDGDNKITIFHSFAPPKTGDTLFFFDAENRVLLGEAVIVEANVGTYWYWTGCALTLDKSVSSMGLKLYDEKTGVFGTRIFNNSLAFPNCEIRNNQFINNRGGIQCKTNGSLIEGNSIIRSSMPAINCENYIGIYNEGYFARDMIIRNNLIDNCAYIYRYQLDDNYNAAQITFRLMTPDLSRKPGSAYHTNILIENNQIVNYRSAFGIDVCNVDGLTIRNNFIQATEINDNYTTGSWGNPASFLKFSPIRLKHSKCILIEENNFIEDNRIKTAGRIIDKSECSGCEPCLSVLEENKQISCPLTVFPNPASHSLTVQLKKEVKKGELILYDLNGKIILQQTIKGKTCEISLSHIAVGSYVLHLVNNGKISSGVKVVKQ